MSRVGKVAPKERMMILKELNAPRGDGAKIGLKGALHEGQVTALAPLFDDRNIGTLLIACGRKFGKTELALYLLWRQALLFPNSAVYYVAPSREQAKKLLWDVRRLHHYMSEKYQDGKPNNRDLMIRLKNGSFIQLMGSENYEAANGLSPHLIVYDEFKAFNPNFHRTMGPNRVTHGAKLVVIGTLADSGAINRKEYFALMKFCKEDPSAHVHVATTFDNPINKLPYKKRAIEEEIALLRARGDEDVVQREFFSRIIPGGSRSVFPMFSRVSQVVPHEDLKKEIEKDMNDLQWYCTMDPGSSTCFAVLFVAINPFTKQVYVLDEIYKTKQDETVISIIGPEIMRICRELNPFISLKEDWVKTYDEAGRWAANEILATYDLSFQQTMKWANEKDAGLSLIKDIMLHGLIKFSSKCVNTIDEVENYAKNDKGKIPKINDHTIDCLRYTLFADNYDINEALRAKESPNTPHIQKGRFRSFQFDSDVGEEYFGNYSSDFDWD